MRATVAALIASAVLTSAPAAQTKSTKTFDIYLSDTEGGKAALFVSPSGESVLVDTGNPNARDTDRIMAMLSEAGVKAIDHVILTHYHVDHIGGLQELARRVPIKHYIDHGPSVEEREQVQGFQAAYAELYAKARHTVVKPGDKLPVAGLDWRIVTAAGKAITTALPGGGKPNPGCASFTPRPATNDPENGQSVGSVITFGKFRTIDLGDLLWDREKDFMCPNNLVGPVDLYIVSHHGIDASGSPALVHGLQPRVAIQQNGTRKGGTLQTNKTLYSSPGFEDVWQLHWSYNVGTEYNPAGIFIANIDEPTVVAAVLTAPPGGGRGGPPALGGGAPPAPGAAPSAAGAGAAPGAGAGAQSAPPAVAAPPSAAAPIQPPAGAGQPSSAAAPGQPGMAPPAGAPGGRQGGGRGGFGPAHTGPAFWIKVSAQADGTFTVTNTRNGFSRTYRPR
jgi:beta-lactamase superfamily II metal-dependent hydrolase